MKIAILNGPNLNLLGVREPERYGSMSLPELETALREVAATLDVELVTAQSNAEGALIDRIHGWRGDVDGVVINAGAYSHSSLAIRDAFASVRIPYVEVHISNIYAREPERRHSMLAGEAIGLVCGLGTYGYELALRGLIATLRRSGVTP